MVQEVPKNKKQHDLHRQNRSGRIDVVKKTHQGSDRPLKRQQDKTDDLDQWIQDCEKWLESLEKPRIQVSEDLRRFDRMMGVSNGMRPYFIETCKKAFSKMESRPKEGLKRFIKKYYKNSSHHDSIKKSFNNQIYDTIIENKFSRKDLQKIIEKQAELKKSYKEMYQEDWENLDSLEKGRKSYREKKNNLFKKIKQETPQGYDIKQHSKYPKLENYRKREAILSDAIKGAHQRLENVNADLGLMVHLYFLEELMIPYELKDGRVVPDLTNQTQVDCGPSCIITIISDKNLDYRKPEYNVINKVALAYKMAEEYDNALKSNPYIFGDPQESEELKHPRFLKYMSQKIELPLLASDNVACSSLEKYLRSHHFTAKSTQIRQFARVLRILKHPIPYEEVILKDKALFKRINRREEDRSRIPSMITIKNHQAQIPEYKGNLTKDVHGLVLDGTRNVAGTEYADIREPSSSSFSSFGLNWDYFMEKRSPNTFSTVPKFLE